MTPLLNPRTAADRRHSTAKRNCYWTLICDFQKAISLPKGYNALQIAKCSHYHNRCCSTAQHCIIPEWAEGLGKFSTVMHNCLEFFHPSRIYILGCVNTENVFYFTWHPALLASLNNETAAMVVSQTSPAGVQPFSYAKTFFYSNRIRVRFVHSTFNIFYFISFKNRKSQITLLVSFSCLKFY